MDLLVTKYLVAGIAYEGIQRVETLPVPEGALREAVLNAIAHKDYSSGTPIQISVYADKLLIWNPGQLPPDWTVEKLLEKHSARRFNPDVANAFFRAGMIESWGRGIERILEECRSAGAPEPKLRHEADGLWVEFSVLPSGEKSGVKTGKETGKETREEVLALVSKNPKITTAKMAEKIGISAKGVEWQIAKLKAEGILRRVGSTKAGHWEIIR